MRRRDFLRLAAGVPMLGAAGGVIAAAAPTPRRLLVLIELKGGNDGLNTVIPYADPDYARLRPRLAIARDEVVQLTEKVGLHPGLEKLRPLWTAGELAVVQGVGYPDPNLSHFRSIEIWETASKSDEYLEDGWLARTFAQFPSPPEFAADGVVIGRGGMGPLAGRGARAIALTSQEQFLREARLARPEGEAGNAALEHILRVERDVIRSADRLQAAKSMSTPMPGNPFGAAVGTAARLAANDPPVAVVRLTLNGFDTHSNQRAVQGVLLGQLGEGIAALRDALVELGRWDRTLIATYAEFGRRSRE